MRATDPRLTVELFAEAPKVFTPTGLAVGDRGGVWVIESHTHQRRAGYDGPKRDRIRRLTDPDGDGRADRVTTFYQGFTHAMDLAFSPAGVLHVSTRNGVYRLPDRNKDGKADAANTLLRLETDTEYPHNGLSDLSFDARGRLYVGLGENGGAEYTLIGADGSRLRGSTAAAGGAVIRCQPDGADPTRFAEGFWNPWGGAFGPFGRYFVADNDPHESPPCRLLHVVEGGDYGYEDRYGRGGRNVMQSWDGELPGNLPMAAGTSEAPGGVVAYESDALPAEYRGRLIVPSWSDRRVDVYRLERHGASVSARRATLVTGSRRFKPVDADVAPDGTVYLSDWARSSYPVHGHGRIWRIRPKRMPKCRRPDEARRAAQSADRRTRRRAAHRLARRGEAGRSFLWRLAREAEAARVRATAIQQLAAVTDRRRELVALARGEPDPRVQALAVSAALERGGDPGPFADAAADPAVRARALRAMRWPQDRATLLDALDSSDPFIRTAAVLALSETPRALVEVDPTGLKTPRQRAGLLLALQRSRWEGGREVLPRYFDDPSARVRFVVTKWVSDRRMTRHQDRLQRMLRQAPITARLYRGILTALDRLDGEPVKPRPPSDRLTKTIFNDEAPPRLRALALRLVDPGYEALTVERMRPLTHHGSGIVRLNALRTLQQFTAGARFDLFAAVARDEGRRTVERAAAALGLAESGPSYTPLLIELAMEGEPALRAEALRSLVDRSLSEDERERLRKLARQTPRHRAAVKRALGEGLSAKPPREELAAWRSLAEGPGDGQSGRRIFFHRQLASCSTCHRFNGRGRAVGPDLTGIARTADRGQLVESLVRPNARIAPHYELWRVTTKADGGRRTRLGMTHRKGGRAQVYRDVTGGTFRVRLKDLVRAEPLGRSPMPPGLLRNLTRREVRDLMAFLLQNSKGQAGSDERSAARRER